MKKLLMKIKLRSFTEDELLAALNMLDCVNRDKLNDERIWASAQGARIAIAKELLRRGVVFW